MIALFLYPLVIGFNNSKPSEPSDFWYIPVIIGVLLGAAVILLQKIIDK